MVKLTEQQKKDLVAQHEGETIQTVFGPSSVIGMHDDGKHVALSENGETYYLTIDDFVSQL